MRSPVWALGAAILLMPPVAQAQPVIGNPAAEELRRGTPTGAADDRTIDTWLTQDLLAPLVTEPDQTAGTNQFLDTLRQVRRAPDTTQAFLAKLAERAAVVFKGELDKGAALPASTAVALVQALAEMEHPGTVPALLSALSFPADSVRYFGARGLQVLRERIAQDPAARSNVLGALRQAGLAESNPVVLERIYMSMAFPQGSDDVVGAITAVLGARIQKYREGASLADYAELAALEYLSTLSLTQPQAAPLVAQLAVLLRLDVERYAGQQFLPEEQDATELRTCATESLLEQLVSPASDQAGKICNALQTGGPAVKATVQYELDKWIGSPGTEGVLNVAPWNVPRGAP